MSASPAFAGLAFYDLELALQLKKTEPPELMILRGNMKKEKVLVFVFLSLFVIALMTGAGLVQGQTKTTMTPSTKPAKPETETLKGTVDHNERLGGYFIRGVEPGGEFFIVNQNAAVLKKLKGSGKTVTIEGYTTKTGAEYFFIQKIDGKKYSVAKKSPKKPVAK
jgi:hypothetical protein